MSTSQKSLVWLASYPKSGNTWLRAFLANYIKDAAEPVPLNELKRYTRGDSQPQHYLRAASGQIDVNDPNQTLFARLAVLKMLTSNGADINFVKTHCENKKQRGKALAPALVSKAAIHIVRDPRDVVLSFASFFELPIDGAIRLMADPHAVLYPGPGSTTQWLGSWSNNVTSWGENKRFPTVTVRYEDLKADPATHFAKVLETIGFPPEQDRIERAVALSSFKQLKALEQDQAFEENSGRAEGFFRTGQSGGWQDKLTDAQVQRIETEHGEVMRAFAYL